jgi:hypothetical protein
MGARLAGRIGKMHGAEQFWHPPPLRSIGAAHRQHLRDLLTHGSAVIGSWKIMPSCAPRRARIASSGSASRSRPSSRMRPRSPRAAVCADIIIAQGRDAGGHSGVTRGQ